jgi:hypothetical protein
MQAAVVNRSGWKKRRSAWFGNYVTRIAAERWNGDFRGLLRE